MTRYFLLLMLFVPFLPVVGAMGGTGTGASAITGPLERELEAGVPFIRNYSPKEYGGETQNWAIVQDKQGVIYVGNKAGILEYDGVRWRLIRTPNKTTVRSLALDDRGSIFVGAQGEIGYLMPDEKGTMRYVSLNDRIDKDCRGFSDIWDIHVTPQGVFFKAREYLFLLARDRIRAWKAKTGFHKSSFVMGRLLIRQNDIGLMEVIGDKLDLVKGGERFAQERIYVMVPFNPPGPGKTPGTDGRILIGTRTQGFFLFDNASFTPFLTEADAYLKKSFLYHGVLLGDGTVALATLLGGMVRMSPDGILLSIVDKASGLLDDNVYFIQPDGQSGLWLALEKGLAHVELPATLTSLDERSGLKGSVLGVHRHMGTLYVGTRQGVYLLEPASHNPFRGCLFKPVAGITYQGSEFLSFDEILLAATSQGVFEIRGDKAFLLRPSNNVTTSLLRSRSDPARVFVGLQDGLASIYHRDEGQNPWVDEGKVAGITEEVRTMVETGDKRLWLGTQAQGILCVTFPEGWKGGASGAALQVERFGLEQGLPKGTENYIYLIGESPAFATHQGIYRFEHLSKHFVPDSRFAGLFPEGARFVSLLRDDSQNRVWLDSVDENRNIHEAGVAVPQRDGTYRWEKAPFLRFSDMSIWCLYPDAEGVVWFGGPDGLIRYDPRIPKDYAPAYPALIRRVDKAGTDLLFGGALEARGPSPIPDLRYAENSLRFEFALPAFDQPEANRYQTRLEGLDRGWSLWTAQNMKEYTNLPEGSYVFRVKARNVYGKESQEGAFAFTISPPWHRTWPAYLGFSVSAIGLLVGGVRAYTYKLHREKDRLEKLVAQRTQELKEASLTDPLTGLRNRRYITEILANDVTAFVGFKKYVLEAKDRRNLTEQQRAVFGVVMFDIDHFKMVNDTYGHDAGDKVLQQFARILKESVRADDAVMRTGGEEFLVVLKKTMPEYLETFIRKVMVKIQQHDFQVAEKVVLKRTCSMGYAAFPFYEQHPDLLSFEQTIMVADLGLYYAKEHGRNLAVRIDSTLNVPGSAEDVQKMVTSLDFALKNDYFTMKT